MSQSSAGSLAERSPRDLSRRTPVGNARARRRIPVVAALLAALAVSAADGEETKAPAFVTGSICIERVGAVTPWQLKVEFADTPEQRAHGLMYRPTLPPDTGMLFRYPETQAPETGFWMPHVPFPLDIAFMDHTGMVLATRTMPPCPYPERSPCPSYPAEVPYRSALEVNAGTLSAHRVLPGQARIIACGATHRGRTRQRR